MTTNYFLAVSFIRHKIIPFNFHYEKNKVSAERKFFFVFKKAFFTPQMISNKLYIFIQYILFEVVGTLEHNLEKNWRKL